MHPPSPAVEDRERLIQAGTKVPEPLAKGAVVLAQRMAEANIPLDHLSGLLTTVSRSTSVTDDETSRLVKLLIALPPDKIPAALIAADAIVSGGLKVEDHQVNFHPDRLERLSGNIYADAIRQFAMRYPEKRLDEVVAAFRNPGGATAEPIDERPLSEAVVRYRQILDVAESLVGISRMELAKRLQLLVGGNPPPIDDDKFRTEFFAHARELFRRDFGVYRYNTQILAALLLTREPVPVGSKGRYAEIATGEGKSLFLALAASYQAALGKRVDIVTSNEYLASRDDLKFKKFFADLGVQERVRYVTASELVFTHLQFRLHGKGMAEHHNAMQAELPCDVAFIDEADDLGIDNALQAFRLASTARPIFDAVTLQAMITFVDECGGRGVESDIEQAAKEFIAIEPERKNLDPFTVGVFLVSAVASGRMEAGVHFVLEKDEVMIVDVRGTGRKKPNQMWSRGLHEFVTLRSGKELPKSVGKIAQACFPNFLGRYDRIICISGTFGNDQEQGELRPLLG